MQKVVGFFSKPENLFVLTLLIGLFTGTYTIILSLQRAVSP